MRRKTFEHMEVFVLCIIVEYALVFQYVYYQSISIVTILKFTINKENVSYSFDLYFYLSFICISNISYQFLLPRRIVFFR